MALQPCGCGSTEADWPYDNFAIADANGLKCGDDGSGNTDMWVEPTGDVGAMVATKALASGLAEGSYTSVGTMTERAGASYFSGNVFTAPREGMYHVTWKMQPSDDIVGDGGFTGCEVFLQVLSDYAAWGNPFLESHDTGIVFYGGAPICVGELPCLEGGTLTFEVLHIDSPEMQDIYAAVTWRCPIPT